MNGEDSKLIINAAATDESQPQKVPTLGGPLGFDDFDNFPQAIKTTATIWREKLGGDDWEFPPLRDPEFVQALTTTQPEIIEQLKYVENTAKYLRGRDQTYDPQYVLLFRRTLPSEQPKPERHWATDYIAVRKGLTEEIPSGPHRFYSIILCSTLKDVLSDVGLSREENPSQTDGEIKVDTPTYDQKRAIFSFRPADQQRQLDQYLQSPSGLSLKQVLGKLAELKQK